MKKFMRENLKFICLALIILAGSFAIGTNVKKAGAATRNRRKEINTIYNEKA